MRKIKVKLAIATFIWGIMFLSCQKDEPKPAELISIVIKAAPTKVNYFIGETLELSGLVVTLNIDNGETEDISFSDFASKGITCSPANGAKLFEASTLVTITHTASGKSVSQTITVTEIEVTSISVKTSPTKVEYFVGEVLELSGLIVKLTMNNGETEDVSISNFESKGIICSPENKTRVTSELIEVVINHIASGKIIKQFITVSNVTDIQVKTEPIKTDYYVGETLELSGLVVTLSLDNGTSKDIVLSNFESKGIVCSPNNGTEVTSELTELTCKHKASGKSTNQTITTHIILTDIDGNTYPYIKIDNQLWMAKNLRTTTYSNGTPITLVENYTNWSNLTTEAYCWYEKDSDYGALYNWHAVNTGELCPDGWHVATYEEWTALIAYFGDYYIAGGKLKESGTTHWTNPNTGATNESGFTALPGGERDYNGMLRSIRDHGYWWINTEYSSTNAWYSTMSYLNSYVGKGSSNKKSGYSVRCVRN